MDTLEGLLEQCHLRQGDEKRLDRELLTFEFAMSLNSTAGCGLFEIEGTKRFGESKYFRMRKKRQQ
jgi:hypothetical protein